MQSCDILSTHLFRMTAFVLRIFTQANYLDDMFIDQTEQQKAIQFLQSKQISNGSFFSFAIRIMCEDVLVMMPVH